jgi:DNA repair exonuclease SbcCD ATPase subunit
MQTRTAAQIETELNQTNARRGELQEMRESITGKLAALQTGFIDGTAPLDALQTEQARLTTLSSSITALDAKQGELQKQLAGAVELESENASLEKATAIAIEAAAGIVKYVELRNEFDEIIRERSEQLFDRLKSIRGFQSEYKETLESVDGLKIDLRAASGDAARLDDVKAELRRKEMSDDVMKWASSNDLNVPPVESDWAFQLLLNSVVNKREAA